jgi:hypothetical protein
MAFILNSDVKPYLNITDASKDTLIDSLITQVQALFEGYLNAPIESGTVTEYYEPHSNEFLLKSLKASNAMVYSIDYENVEELITDSHIIQIGSLYYIKSEYADRFKVVYTSGLATIPNDLKMAGVLVVAGVYKMIDGDYIGLKQKTDNMGSGASADIYRFMNQDPMVIDTLNRYRIPHV